MKGDIQERQQPIVAHPIPQSDPQPQPFNRKRGIIAIAVFILGVIVGVTAWHFGDAVSWLVPVGAALAFASIFIWPRSHAVHNRDTRKLYSSRVA